MTKWLGWSYCPEHQVELQVMHVSSHHREDDRGANLKGGLRWGSFGLTSWTLIESVKRILPSPGDFLLNLMPSAVRKHQVHWNWGITWKMSDGVPLKGGRKEGRCPTKVMACQPRIPGEADSSRSNYGWWLQNCKRKLMSQITLCIFNAS